MCPEIFSEASIARVVPAVPFLVVAPDGRAHLVGSRCMDCGAIMPGRRIACAACGARGRLESIQLAESGRLCSYTVVHRSFPGVMTPFVAAIVNLDGGGTLKGTLTDVTPDPRTLPYDMPVEIVYRDSGQKAADGSTFLSYYFVPSRRGHR
ncbi:OB-fold domain-containing protein [Caballeronia sp. SEWSISQ10-4 2]|uniref:Zn-ribbon domain-containing OB-fold protein n=1 Tax=Caballeronia sp. SEWSISQ10-4 2 TaxID=2937438 RepID=UPI00264AF4A8|nr:OB-fold domain-containing protein [Caballeronia sp. SEWSISQ10-4 2]MDN7184433.1 OB-fold domain-containing protein [Caballeronia sp. SEWSISQ10-4 2]